MDQLTPFERALLDQFRRLADEFDRSQLASEDMSKQLGRWSRAISERLGAIEKRQAQIEAFQTRLLDALTGQNAQTESLVKQVNALLDAQRR